LRDAGIDYSLDHIVGLPGEGIEDQREAVRFYNDVRPARIHVHWMTYFPGTVAFEQAAENGTLTPQEVERILSGAEVRGYDAPRLLGPGRQPDLDEITRLSVIYDALPMLPHRLVEWLVESGVYRRLPKGLLVRNIAYTVQAAVGDVATRERIRTILAGAVGDAIGRKLRRRQPDPLPFPSIHPPRPAAPEPRQMLRVL
jgi:hypothetical protein